MERRMNWDEVILVFLALNTLVWALRHLVLSRANRRSFSLSSHFPLEPRATWPKVSLLVAARNESSNIGRCLESLLRQDYEPLEIIAINDRSEDDTGEIIDRLAAASAGRLLALHAADVPEGWLGKPNAMRLGVEHATGELLCFTDADCSFVCPLTVRIAVAYALENQVDLLSVLPRLETSSFWESVLQPVCSAVLMVWFKPDRVNDPTSDVAYANGAFLLFRRAVYEAIGGHAAAKGKVNEDMEFARLVKGSGRRLWIVPNRDLYRTRMYDSFRSTFRGWSRIFYGCFARVSRVVGAALLLAVMSVAPFALFLGTLGYTCVSGWREWDTTKYVLALSTLAMAAQMSVIVRFYRLIGAGRRWALTYPLGAVLVLGMLGSALAKFLGTRIVWRGRVIPGGKGAA